MKQKPTVYLETSFISYLSAEPSHNLTTLQRQISSRDWWTAHRNRFTLLISAAVVTECARGNKQAASQRTRYLEQATVLDTTEATDALVTALLSPPGPLPANATFDALHIAIASVAAADYLLTWNLKHIANPYMRRKVDTIIRGFSYEPPIIVTADQLIEGASR